MDQQHQAAADPAAKSIEEVAGDAMGSLLQFALRFAKQRFGESHALAALNQIEAGTSRLHAAVDIGDNLTRIRCLLVPHDRNVESEVLADIDLIRPRTSH